MNSPPSIAPPPYKSVHLARCASAAAILVGLVVLIGWAMGVDLFKSVLPEFATMNANTALAFVLVGASLGLSTVGEHQRIARRATALAAIVIGGGTLAQYALGLDLRLDEFMFADHHFETGTTLSSRMAPATAVSFLMLGMALLVLPSETGFGRGLVQGLAISTMLISALALIGYIFGVESFYRVYPYPSVALHTAALLLVVSCGLLCARADFEITSVVTSRRMGGLVSRRLFPAVLVVPILLGWLPLEDERLGFYSLEFRVAAQTVLTIVVLSGLLWWSAHSLNKIDEQRELAKKAEHDLRILSDLDPLTGLLNRRSFRRRLEDAWTRRAGHEEPLGFIMLDIDYFKSVNDTYGHSAGDAVIRTVAELLVEQCRPTDLVCRYGGEEFCILAAQTSMVGAAKLAERIRSAFAETQIQVRGTLLSVSSSFGVTDRLGDLDTVDEMIERADQALHAAKQSGRNRVISFAAAHTPVEFTEEDLTAILSPPVR
jgi:diguanylate cyclase (GGDEF)-like protein